jgi:hypothetical protein
VREEGVEKKKEEEGCGGEAGGCLWRRDRGLTVL